MLQPVMFACFDLIMDVFLFPLWASENSLLHSVQNILVVQHFVRKHYLTTVNEVNAQKHNLRVDQSGSSLDFRRTAYDREMHYKPVHCCGVLTDSKLGQTEVALQIFVGMRDKETENETVPVKPGHMVITWQAHKTVQDRLENS